MSWITFFKNYKMHKLLADAATREAALKQRAQAREDRYNKAMEKARKLEERLND